MFCQAQGLQIRPGNRYGLNRLQRSKDKHTVLCSSIRDVKNQSDRLIPKQSAKVAAAFSGWLRGGMASVAIGTCCLALSLSETAYPASAVTELADTTTAARAVAAQAVAPQAMGGDTRGLETVYFGNGCFWGRQKDFVDVEMKQLGRGPEELTALVGYAAGTRTGPDGKVCYVYSDPRTHYDSLGHAEVVQLGISANNPQVAEAELRAFTAKYFNQFKKTPGGMQRSDPQDKGSAYRNVIGIPGGMTSPFFHIIQEENKYGMELLEGRGNDPGWWGPTEDDILNTVWVVDSSQLPFYRAEKYHQFHNGLGKTFSMEYLRDLRGIVANQGRIEPTGCPELPF